MKIEIKGLRENPINMLRDAGYTFQRNDSEEMSFIRPFSASGYPRFHIYAKISGTDMIISIHLDVNKETYGDKTRHQGEYQNEGPLADEVKRLKMIWTD